jgi:hypothetical protein
VNPIVTEIGGVRATARPLCAGDLPSLLAYWHESPPEYLAQLGVDVTRIGTRADTLARFASSLDDDDDDDGAAASLTVVVEMGGEVVAYTNMQVVAPDAACAHMHTLRRHPAVTAAAYRLFGEVSAAALRELGVSRLRFEASVDNRGINKYLQSFGLEPRTVRIDHPHGMARRGLFNIYHLDQSIVASAGEDP